MDDFSRSQSEHPTGLIVAAVALLAVGLVMVASASASLDNPLIALPLWHTLLGRQLIFAVVGVAVMLTSARLVPRLLSSPIACRRAARLLFVLAIGFLVAALIPSLTDAHRGSQRWLRLGSAAAGLSFQPSELAKVALVVFVASLLGADDAEPRSLRKGFLPAAVGVGLCVLLVGKADFGTAALLAAVGALMLFVARCRLRHMLALGACGIAAMIALLCAEPYRLKRLVTYLDVWQDPLGAGYQPIQSLTAIASGSWLGTGLGGGVQKYGYLPDGRSDFIFSLICEETGVLGGALIIALFCALVWLGLRAMLGARTRFERLLAFGLTATIGLQAMMHIAVVTVVAPTTGISLPLVSAGGSGLTVFCLLLGLLAAVATRGCGGDLFSAARAQDGCERGLLPQQAVSPRGLKPAARFGEKAPW